MKKYLLLLTSFLISLYSFAQLTKIYPCLPDTLNIRAVSEKNGTLYLIVSRYKTVLFERTYLYKSVDNGNSWSKISQFTMSRNPIFFSSINDHVHYICFKNDTTVILKTTNACKSFDTLSYTNFTFAESFFALNKDTVVFNGIIMHKGKYLFISRDGHQTYDTIPIANDIPLLRSWGYNKMISIINDSTWATVTNRKNSDEAALIFTQDAGASWDTINNNILGIKSKHFRSISLNNNKGVFIYNDLSTYPAIKKLLLTTDTGHTFTLIDSFDLYLDANIRNNGYIYVWGYKTFRLSKDNGNTWNTYQYFKNSSGYSPYRNIHPIFVNDTTIILDTYQNLYTNDPIKGYHKLYRLEANSVGISSSKETLSKFKAFPNPFKDIIYIQSNDFFSGAIQLLDLQGHIILRKKEHYTHTIQIDGSNLSPGIYFVKLIANSNSKVGILKLIKL